MWPEVVPYINLLKKGDKVLDVGCGNGRLLTAINKEITYTGFDFSETLINEARSLHPENDFRLKDVLETWGELGKYEAIFCIAVLHHIESREKQLDALVKIRQHLKKDGFAYLSVWNLWQSNYLKWHLRSLLTKRNHWRWLYVPFQKKYQRFCFAFDKRYLEKLLKDAGLRTEKIFYAGGNLCAEIRSLLK